MPCALTSNSDYPDYLKKILKEIDLGDDDEAKACACKIITPVTDEGCEILDEDDKTLAFPFCLPTETIVSNIFYSNTTVPIGLSYKQAMNIYWKRKPFNMQFEANGIGNEHCQEEEKPGKSSGNTSFKCEEVSLKELVCVTPKGGDIYTDDLEDLEPNARKGFTRRSDSCYPAGIFPPPYFGVSFEIFAPSFKLVEGEYIIQRAWIDRQNKKIYPVIQVYINLNGCCGVLGPDGGQASDSSIIINAVGDEGSSGTVKITDFMA